MKASRSLLFLLVATLVLGCAEPAEHEVVTETIQPASPPPVAPGDDASVLTQTTEIGDERSPNEGGILTNPNVDTRGSRPPATATRSASTQPPASREPEQ